MITCVYLFFCLLKEGSCMGILFKNSNNLKTNFYSYFKFIIVLFLSLASLQVTANWSEKSFNVMGTQAKVQFWHSNEILSKKLIADVVAEMHRIDQSMSPYIESSELSQVNLLASSKPLVISNELYDLLMKAEQISKMSNGAFDITYASVGYRYNYRNNIKPSEYEIKQGIKGINYQSLKLNKKLKTVFFENLNTRIDLGGIAKGHAVKNCLEILKKAGVKHGLVSAGGDTGLIGDKKGRPWMVAIKHPRADHKAAVHLPLTNEAISTSGDYERYFVENGQRYHHILNPKTGKSANEVVSVSVIGDDPTMVDALSTTLFVLGLEGALNKINSLEGYEAVIIDKYQKLHFSEGLLIQ